MSENHDGDVALLSAGNGYKWAGRVSDGGDSESPITISATLIKPFRRTDGRTDGCACATAKQRGLSRRKKSELLQVEAFCGGREGKRERGERERERGRELLINNNNPNTKDGHKRNYA